MASPMSHTPPYLIWTWARGTMWDFCSLISSAFNTIVPLRLFGMLRVLGLYSLLCRCLLDFLTAQLQVVNVDSFTMVPGQQPVPKHQQNLETACRPRWREWAVTQREPVRDFAHFNYITEGETVPSTFTSAEERLHQTTDCTDHCGLERVSTITWPGLRD